MASSKAEYLKKYLGDGDLSKKKKKKKKPISNALKSKTGLKLIDEDVDFQSISASKEIEDDDAPTVAEVIDERPVDVIVMEEYKASKKWKSFGATSGFDNDEYIKTGEAEKNFDEQEPRAIYTKRRKSISDELSPKRHKHDIDQSPPRQKHDSNQSPPRRKRHDSDQSSPRRQSRDSDQSPPRRQNRDSDQSPPRRRRHDSDQSSPRRQSRDSDQSPPRKQSRDSDQSPPRRQSRDSDHSPPRRQRHNLDRSSPANEKNLPEKTLSGKVAGLSSAKAMRIEAVKLKRKEDAMFGKIGEDLLGKNAKTVFRDKSGKRRNLKAEEEAELEKKTEWNKKYEKWSKGVAQNEAEQVRLSEMVHEMNKPLARAQDDEDLDAYLKQQDRAGDPMLQFMKKKKDSKSKAPKYPTYKGPAPAPNRFGIRPGYRWDGVDRGNGFEKKYFESISSKKAIAVDAYKWSTEDM